MTPAGLAVSIRALAVSVWRWAVLTPNDRAGRRTRRQRVLTALWASAAIGAVYFGLVRVGWVGYADVGTIVDDAVIGQTVAADEYNQAFEGAIPIHLHFPDAPNRDTGLMVVLHGVASDYHQYDGMCADWRNRFNCIMLQVNYRGSSVFRRPYDLGKYQAIDVLRAVQWVRRSYTVNDRRIIGWGGSGGGNVILQCAKMAPHTFSVVIDCAGFTHPTNAAEMAAGWDRPDRPGGWQGTALGGTNEYSQPERLIRDPIYHAALIEAKVYIFHPSLDTAVGVQHGIEMAYALRKAGKDVVFNIIEGADHSFSHALDPNERGRKRCTEYYAGDDILHRRTDGRTDFERREPVVLPVGEDLVYRVTFDAEGVPSLEGPLPAG